jgi:transglutaminase-like putative cysteine protease
VEPSGRRVEASSMQGSTVRFRGLQVGSAVVVQFRRDSPPVGHLARHLARTWYFQGFSAQNERSEWVLWVPEDVKVHEMKSPEVIREERTQKEKGSEDAQVFKRISYVAKRVPPLVPEPDMPRSGESLTQVTVSTVPSWDDFLKWEDALLTDAFRESPALLTLVEKLTAEVTDPLEKAFRIHTHLMEEIRYQQDYENHVAGVKPHPASMVIERGYGDCKDKVVLFMALARRAGLKAEYALIRTRDKGPLRREVPSQQFDHVIVYLPPQPGIAEGRFMDPTADALDVSTLRSDNPGTVSLLYDPETRVSSWREVPYQSPAHHNTVLEASLRILPEGGADGEVVLSAVGDTASQLRRTSRNPERFDKLLQQLVSAYFPAGTVTSTQPVELEDLRKPAAVRMAFAGTSVARREGNDLRVKIPFSPLSPRQFSLAKRKQPLLLGAPAEQRFSVDVQIPNGFAVSRVPEDRTLEAPCFSLQRSSKKQTDRIQVSFKFVSRCERILPEAYPKHREIAEAMMRLKDEELVFGRTKLRQGARTAGAGSR